MNNQQLKEMFIARLFNDERIREAERTDRQNDPEVQVRAKKAQSLHIARILKQLD